MAYIPPLNGGRINVSIGGNTGGTASAAAVSTGTVVLAGGNNIALSQSTNSNGATISIHGSAGGGGTLSMYGLGNTTQNTSGSFDARSVSLNGLGAMTVGYSNGSVQLSAPVASSVTATGIVSISTNGATVSIGAPAYSAGISTNGNTSGTTGFATNQLLLAGGNNITLSQSTGAGGNTLTVYGPTFSNSNGIGFGVNGSVITASHNGLTSQSNQAASATNGSFTFQTIGFSGGNGVTFGTSAGSIVSASVATSYAASNHSHGNPTLNLTNISGTTASASNGLTLSLSAAAPGGGGVALSAAGNSVSNGTVTLSNSNGLAFGMAGSVITGSYTVPTQSAQTQSNIQALYDGANTVATGSVSLGNVNGVTLGLNGQTLTASHNGITSQSNQVITASVSTGSLAGYSNTANINASALKFAGLGNVSVGFSNSSVIISGAGGGGGGGSISAGGTNYTNGLSISASGALTMSTGAGSTLTMVVPAVSQLTYTGAVSMSSNGSTVSIGAPVMSMGITGSTAGGATSGNTVAASNALYLAAGSNITLSQSTGVGGATVSIYGTSGGGGGGGGVALYDGANSISSGTARISAQGALTASVNAQTLNLSVPATSSLVGVGAVSISTNGSTISVSGSVYTSPRWEYPNQVFTTIGAPVSNSLSLQHIYIPFALSARSARIAASISAGSLTTTGSGTVNLSLNLALYTLNGSTLSQLTSGSTLNSYQITASSTAGVSNILNGVREISAPLSVNMTPGDYWIGALLNTAQTGSGLTVSMMGNNQLMTGAGSIGIIGSSAGAGARDLLFGQGLVATAALPSSVALSAINNTSASNVFRAAFYHAIYSTIY